MEFSLVVYMEFERHIFYSNSVGRTWAWFVRSSKSNQIVNFPDKKVKLAPVLNQLSASSLGRLGRRALGPPVLDLGIRFFPLPLYPRGKSPSTH
jgi:hypothetical protein